MDPRIQILRLGLLAAIAACVSVFIPEGLVVLFATGIGLIPGCGCWCETEPPCEGVCVGTVPSEFQIDMTSWVNNSCSSCAGYNDSFILPFLEFDVVCIYSYTIPSPPCSDWDTVVHSLSTSLIAQQVTFLTGPGTDAQFNHGGSSTDDCDTARGPTSVASPPTTCSLGSASATPL